MSDKTLSPDVRLTCECLSTYCILPYFVPENRLEHVQELRRRGHIIVAPSCKTVHPAGYTATEACDELYIALGPIHKR